VPIAIALLLLNGTLMAGIYACAKLAGIHGVAPLSVLAWQLPFAAVVVGAIAARRGELRALRRADLRYAAIAGTIGISLPSLVTFSALERVPAGTIGVIGGLSPVFTYVLALAVRLERFDRVRALGVLLGFAGVLAIVVPRGELPDAAALPWAAAAVAAPLLLGAHGRPVSARSAQPH
jgi:drug/metabolite transporter (DMT)-like permease